MLLPLQCVHHGEFSTLNFFLIISVKQERFFNIFDDRCPSISSSSFGLLGFKAHWVCSDLIPQPSPHLASLLTLWGTCPVLSCLCSSKQTLFSKYDPNGPRGGLTWKTQKIQNTSRHYFRSPIGVKNTTNLKPSVHQKGGKLGTHNFWMKINNSIIKEQDW